MDLLSFVQTEWPKHGVSISSLGDLRYIKSERSEILYIFARISSHLEFVFRLTNKVGFSTYWQRDRGGKTFDIEHLLKRDFDPTALPATHGFGSAAEYSEARNFIGALTLLPRSRNRSLQDQPYRAKLAAYATENILAQTLCQNLYVNNPNVATYVAANPHIGFSSITDFGKSDIELRTQIYTAIANEIWKSP